ncbi:MAG: pyridoxal-dependent decarboxylase, partial [Actinomycetota bacterium]
MVLHRHVSGDEAQTGLRVRPRFDLPAEVGEIPRLRMPARGLGPDVAYQVVHDELLLDGNARLNLATFVSTWMDHRADALLSECANKNMIDKDEYPQTAELEHRCVNILADLWHASAAEDATGCSTTGSSEAC